MNIPKEVKSTAGERPVLQILGAAVLYGLILYLLRVAVLLQVNPFDSYMLLLNSKFLAGIEDGPYFWQRPPFLPLLLTPFFLLENWFFGTGFAEVSARVLAVLFFAGFLYMAWKIFSQAAGKWYAIAGTLLLAANPLLIHHVPFTKEDMPAAFFTAAAFFFYLNYLKHRSKLSAYAVAFLIPAAITTRYNLIPLLFVVIFIHQFVSGDTKLKADGKWGLTGSQTGLKIFCFFIIPASLLFIITSAAYQMANTASFIDGPKRLFHDLLFVKNITSERGDPPLENYIFLFQSMTPPLVLLSIYGILLSFFKRSSERSFLFLWFIIFFTFQTYALGDKEGRYLFPFLIPLYYFAVFAVEQLAAKISCISTAFREKHVFIAATVLCLAAVLPVNKASRELAKWTDPFYYEPFSAEVCREAKAIAGDRKVYWVGEMYPLFPKDYVFNRDDEFAYLYHIYNHVCRFYLGESVIVLKGPQILYPYGGRYGLIIPGIGEYAKAGDVLIVNTEPDAYKTKTLPDGLFPLVLEQIKMAAFHNTKETPDVFINKETPEARILYKKEGEGTYTLEGMNLRDGFYEIYRMDWAGDLAFLYFAEVKEGRFRGQHTGVLPITTHGLVLLHYDHITVKKHPHIKLGTRNLPQ